MAPQYFECSSCRAMFRTKSDLTNHLTKTSPGCKTVPRKRDTIPAEKENSIKPGNSAKGVKFLDGNLVAAMEGEMEEKKRSKRSGIEASVLSSIADGDEDLVRLYKSIPLDRDTKERRINEEVVSFASRKAKINIEEIASSLSRANHISICFLLDTTHSMTPYILGVKEQIVEIVNRIEKIGCGIEGLAFVGYKDWCDDIVGRDHFEVLPFVKSVPDFKTFLSMVRAKGGGDFPEDVIGGLQKAVSLSWPEKSGVRIIFHMGDAPPHGKQKFHPLSKHPDDYPNGHPKDRSLEQLFDEMRKKDLLYFFGRINNECDLMISVFEGYYGQNIQMLNTAQIDSLCQSVMESVMSSISVTYHPTAGKRVFPNMKSLTLEEPDWRKQPRLDGTILTLEFPKSISEIISFAKLNDVVKKCRLQIAPNPFSKGSLRVAYYGKIFYGVKEEDRPSSPITEVSNNIVLKEFISPAKVQELDRQRYICDLEVQTIAAKLALEFNGKLSRTTLNPNFKVKFLKTKVVRIPVPGSSSPRFLAYEKRFFGVSPMLIKYNNNSDFVLDPKSLDDDGRKRLEIATAFSHFTHDITDGYLLVCDLQGITFTDKQLKQVLLLTDPAIHCSKHLRFGKTNLSSVGISQFFSKHVCNQYCKALGLRLPTH